MNFPEFVPPVVQKYISVLIEGNDREPFGWAAALASAEKTLAELDRSMRRTSSGEKARLQKERKDAVRHRDMLAHTVESLTRLGTDDRMGECYEILKSESLNDGQLKRFISIAWAARMDYTEYRERLKMAAKVTKKIAKSADNLAILLRELLDTGVPNPPDEFSSIRALLSHTDHADGKRGERNWGQHAYWRSIRRHVLGDCAQTDQGETNVAPRSSSDGDSTEPTKIVKFIIVAADKVEVGPEEAARDLLHYAWQQSPPVSEMIEAIASAARQYKPSEFGMIGAAIAKRERSKAQNKEYLRAFGKLLEEDSCGIERTRYVMNAIAVAATVVINDRDFVVIYDDVVKAIGGPVETRA